tara:strand:+ start:57 stop:1148 length:1092 start_codon:yes stop_codon:yes gene_type:complete
MIIKNTIRDQSYKIYFNVNLKKYLNNLIKRYYKVALITDKNIYKIYKEQISIKGLDILKVNPGEKSKSFTVKNSLDERLLEKKFNRNSLIIGFGGGVVGDLSGYVAATILRGIDLIHIPTSLIAIVDSSIGGKTGINSKNGKNLIGSFYNPKEILINSEFMHTLSSKEIRQGLSEIIKYGVIKNEEIFNILEKSNKVFMENGKSNIDKIIKKCIKIKIDTVEKDFKEKDLRSILNFGHTIGHALEKNYSYKFSHGDCIGTGMAIESLIAHNFYKLSAKDLMRILKLLDKFKLRKVSFEKGDIDNLLDSMELDKKNKNSLITFSLPKKIGSMMKINNRHKIEIKRNLIKKIMIKYLNEFKNKKI